MPLIIENRNKMETPRFLKRAIDDSVRDFTGLGNIILLSMIFSFFLQGRTLALAIIFLVLTELLCSVIKVFFFRARPVEMEHKNLIEKIQSGSFPSAHSAAIIYFSLVAVNFTNSIFADITASFLIIFVGYSRHYLKKHFISDILGGYAIGFAMFFVFFKFVL